MLSIQPQLSRKLLQQLERHTPDRIRSLETQILLNLAARAFRVPGKKVWHLPADDALRAYAEFTVQCMKTKHAAPRVLYRQAYAVGSRVRRLTGITDSHAIEQLVFYLYSNIRIQMFGNLPAIVKNEQNRNTQNNNEQNRNTQNNNEQNRNTQNNNEQNRNTQNNNEQNRNTQNNNEQNVSKQDYPAYGEIVVTDCYFSRFYTPEQCAVMSSVDSGIIAGLCGGGTLTFTERITEGCRRCRACFSKPLPEEDSSDSAQETS